MINLTLPTSEQEFTSLKTPIPHDNYEDDDLNCFGTEDYCKQECEEQ